MNRDRAIGLITGLAFGVLVGAGFGLALGQTDDDLTLAKQKYEAFERGIDFGCQYASKHDLCVQFAEDALGVDKTVALK